MILEEIYTSFLPNWFLMWSLFQYIASCFLFIQLCLLHLIPYNLSFLSNIVWSTVSKAFERSINIPRVCWIFSEASYIWSTSWIIIIHKSNIIKRCFYFMPLCTSFLQGAQYAALPTCHVREIQRVYRQRQLIWCSFNWPTKAFDCMDHKLLIATLFWYGVSLTFVL